MRPGVTFASNSANGGAKWGAQEIKNRATWAPQSDGVGQSSSSGKDGVNAAFSANVSVRESSRGPTEETTRYNCKL